MLNYEISDGRMMITDDSGAEIASISLSPTTQRYLIRWIGLGLITAIDPRVTPRFAKLEAAKYYVLASYIEHHDGA